MGTIASVKRTKTQPVHDAKAAKTERDHYRQRKLTTRLANPFNITIRRTFVPSSLQYFMKEPANEKKIDFYPDTTAMSMTVSDALFHFALLVPQCFWIALLLFFLIFPLKKSSSTLSQMVASNYCMKVRGKQSAILGKDFLWSTRESFYIIQLLHFLFKT